jgi:ubiquinone/menaquinone biosynthesis C-methylase UbiE
MNEEREYVLGTGDPEIARLSLQHNVWRADAAAAWQRAGFAPGQSIIDLGCGPGFATFDLAELVGREGHVLGVDVSDRFLSYLRRTADSRGLSETIEARAADLNDVGLPQGRFDGAWMRWVLIFLQRPDALLRAAHDALKPGGRLVVQEYFDYRMWRFYPVDPEFAEVVTAVYRSWHSRGGDPDIGFGLPTVLESIGFRVLSTRTITEVVGRGSQRWHWAAAFASTAMERLVALGDVSAADGQRLDATIRRALEGATLMSIPGVIEVIAERS